ncbi:YwqJ-related putative deaminase [Saccharopolyspora sp. 5N708]|uniref:YwqJ-related putative deaminase n=1 Tax=Saccharopolyspora sp. 5N708 TaxID=3457424 RepID=UPI003FD376EE
MARDLSNELGVPVTAPRGLAWTDGNGRVFASDIGPDGRPGWPPNSGWDTHNPDGTSTPASSDGFHPSHDGQDPGAQPDDAEARGYPPRGDELDIETPGHPDFKDKIEDRIQDPDYRNRYYNGPDANGVWRRRDIYQADAAGDQLPAIRENNGRFEVTQDGSPSPAENDPATSDQHDDVADSKSDEQPGEEPSNDDQNASDDEAAGDQTDEDPTQYKPPAADEPSNNPIDFSEIPETDPGAPPAFSESGPSDRTRGALVETLPRDRVIRNDDELITHVKDNNGNFVPVRDYVQNLSQERSEAIAQGTHKKDGPCSAVAIDLRTGMITEGVNGRPNDLLTAENLHPLLRENLESLGAWQYPVMESETTVAKDRDGNDAVFDGKPHFDKPLRHAEVKATNELLWARERSGEPVTRATLDELRIDPRWIKNGGNMSIGNEAAACANCDTLLRGVPSYTGRFSFNPSDYRYTDSKHSIENDSGLRTDGEGSGE